MIDFIIGKKSFSEFSGNYLAARTAAGRGGEGFALVYVIMALLMGMIFVEQGEWRVWLEMLWIFARVIGALLVLKILIILNYFPQSQDALVM